MQIPDYPIQLSLQFGRYKQSSQKLMHFHLANYSQPQQVAQVKSRAKVQDYGNDLIILFRYSIITGRQQQAVKYLESARALQIEKKEMSPLQYLISREIIGNQGSVQIINQGGGFVTVKYRLFQSALQELQVILNSLSRYPTVHLDLSLEGFVSHSLQNLTNVKVDHALLTASSQQNFVPVIKQLLSEHEALETQIIQNPFYSSIGSLKKMKLNLKFKGFRELVKFSNSIEQNIYNKKSEKQDSRYGNSGLFRQNVSAYLLYKDTLGIQGILKHHGEDVFMRLVKVYFKAAKRLN